MVRLSAKRHEGVCFDGCHKRIKLSGADEHSEDEHICCDHLVDDRPIPELLANCSFEFQVRISSCKEVDPNSPDVDAGKVCPNRSYGISSFKSFAPRQVDVSSAEVICTGFAVTDGHIVDQNGLVCSTVKCNICDSGEGTVTFFDHMANHSIAGTDMILDVGYLPGNNECLIFVIHLANNHRLLVKDGISSLIPSYSSFLVPVRLAMSQSFKARKKIFKLYVKQMFFKFFLHD